MNYTPDQIEKTREFMEAARQKGLENERRAGAQSDSGLTQQQRDSIMATAKAAEGLYLEESMKAALLERFVIWSERHGTKVESEKHPYILRQLVEEYMKNDDWVRSGYDGKISATIRGAIIEKTDRHSTTRPDRMSRIVSTRQATVKDAAPILAVPAEEAQQYMQDVRAAFRASGQTLRGTTASIPAPLTAIADQLAEADGSNKFTLRHLLDTFAKMVERTGGQLKSSMAAAVLPKLAGELNANKAFLKPPNSNGMIPLTVKEGDVSKDIQKEFPLLCKKAPEIVRRAVLTQQPYKAHLQKVMDYFEQITATLPEDTRLFNAQARAAAEYRSQGKASPAKPADVKPDTAAAAENTEEPVMPSWLMPTMKADTHAGRIIEGDWSKHDGRGGGRKK